MPVGKVIQTGEGRFQWIISDFLSTVNWQISQEYRYSSPAFSYFNEAYSLDMLVGNAAKKIGFNLRKHYSPHPDGVSVSLRMRTGPRGRMEIRCGKILNGNFFVHNWMTPEEMLQRRSEIFDSYGSLTMFFDMSQQNAESNAQEEKLNRMLKIWLEKKIKGTAEKKDDSFKNVESKFEEEEETVSQRKSRNKMIEDMKLLLASDEDCDVVLKVQDKEFRAHRNILRARSPVFKSMFSHNSAESQSGEVTISDCDPATFPDFLTYVYTGSSRHISAENVCSLYTAADKYCLDTLKEECSMFMMNNMSVDSFSRAVRRRRIRRIGHRILLHAYSGNHENREVAKIPA